MVVLAAGALAVIYVIGALLAGPLAGLAASAMALVSPVLGTHLVRAASEAPFTFFLLLALLLGLLGAQRGRPGAIPARWAVALGLALGLALASKLTAALSLAAVLAWGAAVSLAAVTRDRSAPDRAPRRAWLAGRGWLLAGLVALAVFVASNPHLYPDPVLHIGHLLEHRVERMEMQQRVDEVPIHGPLEGAWFVARGSFHSGAGLALRRRPLEAGLALAGEALLALSGLAVLAAVCYQGWRGRSQLRPEGLVLLTTATYFVGLTAAIHVSWDRYLVPTSALVAVLSGVGVGAWLGRLGRLSGWASVPGRLAPNRR
jgi:4-amino-4-deoxy-L-arabinose transferase-like glycosyltransferase